MRAATQILNVLEFSGLVITLSGTNMGIKRNGLLPTSWNHLNLGDS